MPRRASVASRRRRTEFGRLAVAACLAGGLIASSAPAAGAAVTNGQIVAVVKSTSSISSTPERLVTVNADGSGVRTILTAAPRERFFDPKWSPDGNRIAFGVNDSEHAGRIAVYDVATGVARTITDHICCPSPFNVNSDWSPTWLPDGRIAFIKHRGAPVGTVHAVVTVNPDGSDERMVWDAGYPRAYFTDVREAQDIDFSPDGSRFAFVGQTVEPCHVAECGYGLILGALAVVTPPAENATALLPGARGLHRGSLRWSPDGSRLVWSESFRNLRMISASGGEPVDLTTIRDGSMDLAPEWSPDGRWVVYTASPGYVNRIATDGSGRIDPLFPPGDGWGEPSDPDWQPCVTGVTISCVSSGNDGGGGGGTGPTLPICQTVQLATHRNTPLDLPGAPCSDPLGRALTISIIDGPHHGTLTGPAANGHRLYTPAKGFTGLDTIRFRAAAGSALSAPATLTIVVLGGNAASAPSARAVGRLRLLSRGRVRARVRCEQACTVTLRLQATLRTGKRMTGPSRRIKLAAGRTATLALRLPHAPARRRIRKLTAVGAVSDQAGRRQTLRFPVPLGAR